MELTEYLFAILLIMECNSVWGSMEGNNFDKITKVALIFIMLLYIVLNKSVSVAGLQAIMLAVSISAVYCLIYLLATGYNFSGFFFLAICVVAIYVIVTIAADKNRGMQLLLKYKDLVVIIAIVSLVFWFFGSQLGIIRPTGYINFTWGVTDGSKRVASYYGIYFESQSISSFLGLIDKTTWRNTAVFSEAPMFNFHLCIALIIELFYCKKLSKVRCAILIMTILSTLSTTGYCMMIIALVLKYIFSKEITGIFRVMKVIIIPCVVIAGLIVFRILIMNKMGTGSGTSRASDFVTGFQAWLASPLFGYGYGAETYYNSIHYGFSNSVTPILGFGGLFLSIPYLYFTFKWFYMSYKEINMQKFLFFVNFLFLFIFTIVPFKFLTIFILFASGISKEKMEDESGVMLKRENNCERRSCI